MLEGERRAQVGVVCCLLSFFLGTQLVRVGGEKNGISRALKAGLDG